VGQLEPLNDHGLPERRNRGTASKIRTLTRQQAQFDDLVGNSRWTAKIMAKILLVEDQDDIRLVLTATLGHRGHDIEAYADGEAALDAIESSWPEIAIVDSNLPGVSGLQVGRAIDERTGDRKRVFKVLFTGNDSPSILEQLEKSGFDRYIRKPVSIAKLCEELAQLDNEDHQ